MAHRIVLHVKATEVPFTFNAVESQGPDQHRSLEIFQEYEPHERFTYYILADELILPMRFANPAEKECSTRFESPFHDGTIVFREYRLTI